MGCLAQAPKQVRGSGKVANTRSNTLKCANCNSSFDLTDKCPITICQNKHNLCKACFQLFHAKKKSYCYLCKEPMMQSLIKNKELIEVIRENKGERDVVSPTKMVKIGSTGITLQKAEQNGYDEVQNSIRMESLTRTMIDEKTSNIKAIIDLSIFKSLRFLNLSSHNDQICIPGKCKELEDNESYGFGTLPHLKELHLRNRHLHQIPRFGKLPSLQTLGLGRNGISRIKNLDDYSTLKYLFLPNNQIIYIQCLESLVNLECLNLGGNRISKIEYLKNQTKLVKLQLYNNLIAKIQNLDNLTSLEDLDLDDNKIVVVENLRRNTKLTDIMLNNNPIKVERSREELQFLKEQRGIDLVQTYGWKI